MKNHRNIADNNMNHLSLKIEIDLFFKEFKEFKNDITDIEDYCSWNKQIVKFYDKIGPLERLNLKITDDIFNLMMANSYIEELIKSNTQAKKAMKEFNEIDVLNEGELIDWLFKYEENELDYGDYVKVDNWEENNLILHSLDNSVVIDCSGYSDSLMFSEIYRKYYWELFEKYKITDEQFEIAKKKYGVKSFDLRTFLKAQNS